MANNGGCVGNMCWLMESMFVVNVPMVFDQVVGQMWCLPLLAGWLADSKSGLRHVDSVSKDEL